MNSNISKVIDLSPQDFDGKKIIKKNSNKKFGIVMFSMKGCPHCVNFLPVFMELSALLDKQFNCYRLEYDPYGKNNSDIEKVLKSNKISGFPTLMYVNSDGVIFKQYKKARDIPTILNDILNTAN